MAANTFGQRFRVTTFGESHGAALGAIVDGCPAGHPFPADAIARQLARRRPGQSRLTTQRDEHDAIEVLSGVDPDSGQTLGTPIAMIVRNRDARSEHYGELGALYRPSHADFTWDARFGLRAVAGGGRASARETVARVAAGALAEDLLAAHAPISITAWVASIGDIECDPAQRPHDRAEVDVNDVRCPDNAAAAAMEEAILAARKDGDTLGGVVRCLVRGVPAGWGEPVFGKLTASLAGALMSLPAARAFEIGEGLASTRMRGSTHNDAFERREGRTRTRTNHSGGIQGGISNGEDIDLRVAFKPVATIFRPQDTVTRDGREIEFQPRKGRHDPCVLPRAVPMVEAMVALVLVDAMLGRLGARAEELRP